MLTKQLREMERQSKVVTIKKSKRLSEFKKKNNKFAKGMYALLDIYQHKLIPNATKEEKENLISDIDFLDFTLKNIKKELKIK